MAIGDYKKIDGKQSKPQKKKRTAKSINAKAQLFLAVGGLLGVVFLPTTFLLSVALLPTFVVAVADRAKRKTKAVTVGAMNLAGATPFALDLWMQEHSFSKAIELVTDVKAIIIMYSAAGIGYLIDWSMTSLIAGFLLQRGKARSKAIKKQQKELVERWGKEVTGEVAIDQYGFALDQKD